MFQPPSPPPQLAETTKRGTSTTGTPLHGGPTSIARIVGALSRHGVSLAVIAVATMIGQVGALYHQLGGVETLDTINYLAATNNLLDKGQLFDPLRTPGYPFFVAVFLALGIAQPLFWVMIAQAGLTIVTGFEVYLLGYRVSGRQLPAAIAAALCASNIYITQWERDILSETLSYWLIVTLFLIFEWYLRARHPVGLLALAGISLAGVLVRPFNIYVPLVLFALIAVHDKRLQRLRLSWRQLSIAALAVYGILVAYMFGNLGVNHFFGLSNVTNLNEFGKVLEYRLYDATSDPRFATIKANIDAYAAQQPPGAKLDPFAFIYVVHPEYQQDGIAALGKYSQSILLSHPGPVLGGTLGDIIYALDAPANLYHADTLYTLHGANQVHHYEYLSTWKRVILKLNEYEYLLYLLLPVLLVLAGIGWWQQPRRHAWTVIFALALCIAGGILITGGLSYDLAEFSRLRFPFDWGLFLLIAILGTEVITRISQRGKDMSHPNPSLFATKEEAGAPSPSMQQNIKDID